MRDRTIIGMGAALMGLLCVGMIATCEDQGHVIPPSPVVTTTTTVPEDPEPTRTTLPPREDKKAVYYANCAEAREAGAAPIRRGKPGYSSDLDRDGDGVACDG